MRKESILKTILMLIILLPLKTFALDGDYIITSKLSDNMVLDIAGGIIKDDANIQLYTSHDGKNQIWNFTYNEEGYYKIKSSMNNDYCIDFNIQQNNKINVKLSKCNDSLTQKWILEKDDNGYYTIYNYEKNYVLDIAGARPANNSNIQLFQSNNNDNQKFIINKKTNGEKTIEDGIYTISSNNLYMTTESNEITNRTIINFANQDNTEKQKWKVTYLENGAYQISSVLDEDFSLDIPGNKKSPFTKIQLFQNNYGVNQEWIIKSNDDGTFQIISKTNGFNLEYNSNSVYVNEENSELNQKYIFEKTLSNKNRTIKEGVYVISSKINPSMVLDVAGGQAKDYSNIQLYTAHYLNHQKWNFVYNEDGYYYIKSEINNDYCLSIDSDTFQAHNNIIIKSCNNLIEQRWTLKKEKDGYYRIVSIKKEYSIDVTAGKTMNNTNIQLFDSNNSDAQKFTINNYIVGEKTLETGVYEIISSDGLGLTIDGRAYNSTNINVTTLNNSIKQRFLVKYLENGYYSIQSLEDRNYLMDVAGARKVEKTNIQLFHSNNGYNQQWIIKDNGNGMFNIISRLNGMYLDIIDNNVVVNEENTSATQNFKINKIQIGEQVLEDGYYFIDTILNINKSLDVAGAKAEENKNVQIFETNSGLNQKWYFEYIGDGKYKILSNINEEYALTEFNNNIQINKYNNQENQQWIIINNNDGTYSIVNSTYKSISIEGLTLIDKTNVICEEYYNKINQKYSLTKTAGGITEDIINNGYYIIKSTTDENYAIDVAGGRSNNNTNIQLYSTNSKINQKWYFEKHNNYYVIKSGLDNSKVLTVDNDTYKPNVKLFTNGYSYNQQWILKRIDEEKYALISNSNGLYLTIDGGKIQNNSNIQVEEFKNNESQIFDIIKTRLENIVIDVSAHQGTVDWDTVKKSGEIYGVILRISAGSYYIDKKLEENVKALNRLNIPYGVYLYSYAEDAITTVPDLGTYHEAQLEALRIVDSIKKYNINPTLGIYYDLEHWESGRNSHWTSAEYEILINNFDKIMTKNGYPNWKIYANLSMANTSLYPWRDRITWIAQWNDQCTYTGYYNLWQYTSEGSVSGIKNKVDMNIYYID